MGRPSGDPDPRAHITVRVPQHQARWLLDSAEEQGVSRSEFMVRLIDDAMKVSA